MEHAGNHIDGKEERSALKGIGIGTPATRASIIETLFSREYIRRDKKMLVPTEKGLQVYELVKDFKIADVGMTAQWEVALRKIEIGEVDGDSFQKEIEDYATLVTKELLQITMGNEKLSDLLCPKCKNSSLLIRDKLVKYKDSSCNWIQFRMICGVQLGIEDIENLINSGKTSFITGLKSKSGKKFDAYIVLGDSCISTFEFLKK